MYIGVFFQTLFVVAMVHPVHCNLGGRLVEKDTGVGKDEIMSAIRFGAQAVFQNEGAEIVDEDIDSILEQASKRTAEMNAKFDALKEEGIGSKASTWLDIHTGGGLPKKGF